MPPKNNKKKDNKRKELSEEDMHRLGISDEDIARIMAERSKSADDKKADQEREKAHRREAEQHYRAQRELQQQLADLVSVEGKPRVAVYTEEEEAWVTLTPKLEAEHTRLLRMHAEYESARRKEEVKRRRDAELAAYQASLQNMSEADRATFIADLLAKEKEQTAALVAEEEARRAKEERRRLRRERAALRNANRAEGKECFLNSSDEDEGMYGKASKLAEKSKEDELNFAMCDRFLRA